MQRWFAPAALLLVLTSQVGARAQEASEATGRSADESVWVAGVAGGVQAREDADDGEFGTVSITRYRGTGYLRAALTGYRGTLRQADASLPATFAIASLGGGGNWHDWVLDATVSLGVQWHDAVRTDIGTRPTMTDARSSYVGASLRTGRVFRPASRWYVTPTVGLQTVRTRSLRSRLDPQSGMPVDFLLPEKATTANASLRIDRTFGATEQSFLALTASHFTSDNVSTSWRVSGPGAEPRAAGTPDSWEELEAAATVRVSSRLWLDAQAQRTLGLVSGEATTVSLGLRMRL